MGEVDKLRIGEVDKLRIGEVDKLTADEMDRLKKCCKLGKIVDTWTVGALVSFACERETSELVWNWTVDDLRQYVYDKYVDILLNMDDKTLELLEKEKGAK